MDLDSLIAKAKKEITETRTVDQPVVLGDRLVTVRLSSVDGPKWIDITSRHPARPEVPRDVQLGFNLPAVLRAYPGVELVDGDEVDDLQREDGEGKKYSRWPEVHDVLDPDALKNLAFALWGINEYDHQQRLVAAGKASTGQR